MSIPRGLPEPYQRQGVGEDCQQKEDDEEHDECLVDIKPIGQYFWDYRPYHKTF